MTAEAHHYDDLHRLVDQLNRSQADAVRAVVLQLVASDRDSGPNSIESAPPDNWPPAWFGSITAGERDTAERTRDILRAEYGRS